MTSDSSRHQALEKPFGAFGRRPVFLPLQNASAKPVLPFDGVAAAGQVKDAHEFLMRRLETGLEIECLFGIDHGPLKFVAK